MCKDIFRMVYIIYDPEEKSMWDNIIKKAERGYMNVVIKNFWNILKTIRVVLVGLGCHQV